jgi:alanine racemase
MTIKTRRSSTKQRPRIAGDTPGRPTWAEIDLAALTHNYEVLRQLLLPAAQDFGLRISDCGLNNDGQSAIRNPQSANVLPRLIPVIKANAYGHGAVPVARALAAAGATAFAVALVEEAVELRGAGVSEEILVLEGAWPGQEAEVVKHGLTAAVHSAAGLRRLDSEARRAQKPARVHIKVDTGMSRLGAALDEMEDLLCALGSAAALRVAGVFSHLACAEEEDSSYTTEQIRRFSRALELVERAGFAASEIHFANSAGLLYCPRLRTISARPGIALYGYPPAPARSAVDLRPVLTLKTRVGRIHSIHAGESAGYNRRFVAARETRAATLPIGYADGYDRRLTGLGRAIIRGRWAPVLGAVSMDMIVVDITDLPEVGIEEEVILLGSTAECRMDAAEWADILGTIPYEVLCGISSRVPRVCINDPSAAGRPPGLGPSKN